MITPKRIAMRIIEIDKTRAHPVEITFEKRNPENHTMKYAIILIVLIALPQYFRQATHYLNERGNEEEENTLKLNHHHHLLWI